jgi:hypothetical protein
MHIKSFSANKIGFIDNCHYLGSHGGGASSSSTPNNPYTNGKDKDSSDKKHINSASDSTPMNVRIRKQRTQMGREIAWRGY